MNPVSLGVGLMAGSSATAAIVAQAVTGDPSSLGPYVGGGAGVVAVAALAEVTRRLLNGRLVPRETREAQQEMAAYILAAGQREDRAMRIAEDASGVVTRAAAELAESNRRAIEHLTEQLSVMARTAEDLRDELRDLRRGGQQ